MRIAGLKARTKPYDAEVEYLYNDGLTQYVNTGIVPTSLTEVSLGFDIIEPATNLFTTFGGTFIQNNTSATYAILRHDPTQGSNAYNFRVNYNNTINATLAVGSHDVIMNEYGTRALKVDGTTVGTFTGSISVNLPIFLFCRNTSGVGETQYSIPIKLRYCKIKDDNGVLVRDYIPVVDLNDRPALYDRVSKTLFHNAGTGEFTVGPRKYDLVWGIKKPTFKTMPYLEKLEYIESDGTAYIDTGVVPTNTHGFEIHCYADYSVDGANSRVVGAQDGSVRWGLSIHRRGTNTFFGWNDAYSSLGAFYNTDVVARLNYMNDRAMVLNDSTIASDLGTLGTISNTALLFAMSYGGVPISGQYLIGKVYSAKITNGSDIVANYIPVLDKSGQPKMFDLVTQTYPTHYGTFIAGPSLTA